MSLRFVVNFVASALLCAACATDPPRIDSVTLARSVDPNTSTAADPVTTFTAEDLTWHAVVAASDLARASVVTARWYRGAKELGAQSIEVAEGGDANLDFSLEFLWPPSGGDYRVDIYLGDAPAKSLPFALPTAPPTIHSVTLTRGVGDHFEPIDPTTTFSPDDDFIASVEFSDLLAGSELSARWYHDDQSIADPATTPVQEDGAAGFVAFTLTLPGAWPPGEYRVEIYLDGELTNTQSFIVRDSGWRLKPRLRQRSPPSRTQPA